MTESDLLREEIEEFESQIMRLKGSMQKSRQWREALSAARHLQSIGTPQGFGEGGCGMTFEEAFALHGPDVERIARRLGIAPHEADRRINAEMDKRYAQQSSKEFWRKENARKLSEIMEAHL